MPVNLASGPAIFGSRLRDRERRTKLIERVKVFGAVFRTRAENASLDHQEDHGANVVRGMDAPPLQRRQRLLAIPQARQHPKCLADIPAGDVHVGAWADLLNVSPRSKNELSGSWRRRMVEAMSIVTKPRSEKEVDRIVAVIRSGTKDLLKSKKKAREFLIKRGYITKSGKLTKRYGG
jgi:hypothetical protein